jgi:hypothetical protein
MIIKSRKVPVELKILRLLNNRMKLTEKELTHFLHLEKGYEGEKMFDEWLKQLPSNFLVVNDLLLESNNTFFQIDSLVISPVTIYIFEVKNFEGDYIIDIGADKWRSLSGSEIKNPIHQLNRSEILLRQLLQKSSFNPSIESYVVFVNPNFYLYQAPVDLPIIFPTQINRYMNKLKLKSSKLIEKHHRLAKQLLALHCVDSPYKRLPYYNFELLKKGTTCVYCGSFKISNNDSMIVCHDCGKVEASTNGIMRTVDEIQTLFPDIKITTNIVYDWSKLNYSKKTVYRTLTNNLQQIGFGRASYFIKGNGSCE